jgi:hypothetical protein
VEAAKVVTKAVEMQIVPLRNILENRQRTTDELIPTPRTIKEKIASLIKGEEIEDAFSILQKAIQNGFNIQETKKDFEEAFASAQDKKLFLALAIEMELNGFETQLDQKKLAAVLGYSDKESRYMVLWHKKLVRDREGHNTIVSRTEAFERIYEMLFDAEIEIREIALAYLKTIKESENMHNRELISLKIEGERRINEQLLELRK